MSTERPRNRARASKVICFVLIVLCVVIADQASKAAILRLFESGPSQRTFIPGVLDLLLLCNEGAAFSFAWGGSTFLIVVAALVALGIAVYVLVHPQLPWHIVCFLALVAGGGLGNMVDRIRWGSVVDFFKTTFIEFPIFNVADICVTVGTCLLILSILFSHPDEPSEPAATGSAPQL